MPDLGQFLECNNCGKMDPWVAGSRFQRILPPGWYKLENTIAGTVYFCSDDCRVVWCEHRDWQMPAPEAMRIAQQAGFVPPAKETRKPKKKYKKRKKAKDSKESTPQEAPAEVQNEVVQEGVMEGAPA